MTNQLSEKHIITYHQTVPVSPKFPRGVDCPDGITSAAIVAQFLENQGIPYELMGDSYRLPGDYEETPVGDLSINKDDYQPRPLIDPKYFRITKGCTLWIVDFSYPRSWLDYWQNQGVNVRLFDHHEDKFLMIAGFSGAVLNAQECGATLVYKSLYFDRVLPEFLIHVRNRDIGLNGYYEGLNRYSEAINEGYSYLRSKAENKLQIIWDCLDGKASLELLQSIGEAVLIERDSIVDAALERVEWITLMGYEVPCVSVTDSEARYASIIGNRLATQKDDRLFAVVKFTDGGMSLRSTRASKFDVRPVAKFYGGGGHYHASGIPPQK